MFTAALLAAALAAAPSPYGEENLRYDFSMPGEPMVRTSLRCEDMNEALARMPRILAWSRWTLDMALQMHGQGKITKNILDDQIEDYARIRTMQLEVQTFNSSVCYKR